MFLETLYRIYSTAGYNIAHIDVHGRSSATEHDIRHEDVERVEAVVNWLETQYPSPAFPSRREDGEAKPGQHGVLHGLRRREARLSGAARPGRLNRADDPPEVLDLMKRVTIIPSHKMTLFGPRITIYTKDGKSHTKQATGREFIWNFDEAGAPHPRRRPGAADPRGAFEKIDRDLPRSRQGEPGRQARQADAQAALATAG